MADGINVANAYVQIMPSMKGAESSIQEALAPAMEQAGEASGSLLGGGILGKLQGLGPKFAAIGGALVGALGAAKIGQSLLDIGGQFDAMSDAIVVATGASGDELAELGDVARDVATTIPVSFEEAGALIGDLTTRLGLTGDELEAVASRTAAVGELMGSAINTDALTGALNAFNVAGDDAAAKMDYLFGVTQSTGIGFDQLTGILETNAPTMQNLGFSFEEAANMAGLLDKAGIDAAGTMSKMSKALVTVAEPGEDAADAYRRVVGEIGDFIEAGDTAAAIDLASQIFGTRGAAQFVGAVQSGALAMEDLQDASLGAGEGILETFEATADWPERWELIKNKAAAALEPLGGALMDGVTAAFEKISEAMDEIDPATFETLGTALGDLVSGGVDLLVQGLNLIIENKEPIGEFFADFGLAVQNLWTTIEPFATFLGDVLVGVVFPAIEAGLKLLSGDFEVAADTIKGVAKRISDALGFTGLVEKARGVFDRIKSGITEKIEAAKTKVKDIVDKIKGFFSFNISLPHIKLPHIRYDIIEIPVLGRVPNPETFRIDWYAKGGFADGPTLAGYGEAGPEFFWPGYEPYFSKYAEGIAAAMPDQGAEVIRWLAQNLGPTIYGNTEHITRRDYDRMAREAVRTVG